MCTSCVCEACECTYLMVVTPHSDPNANGLRMSKVDFRSPDGSNSWSEIWYLVTDKLYSLRGGEGQRLEQTSTSIVFEAPLRRAFAGAQSSAREAQQRSSSSSSSSSRGCTFLTLFHSSLLLRSRRSHQVHSPSAAGLTRCRSHHVHLVSYTTRAGAVRRAAARLA